MINLINYYGEESLNTEQLIAFFSVYIEKGSCIKETSKAVSAWHVMCRGCPFFDKHCILTKEIAEQQLKCILTPAKIKEI